VEHFHNSGCGVRWGQQGWDLMLRVGHIIDIVIVGLMVLARLFSGSTTGESRQSFSRQSSVVSRQSSVIG
jgi:hypothetical protein